MLAYDIVAPRAPAMTADNDNSEDRTIWERIDGALLDLQAHHRHAIRILDLGCGDGRWLIRATDRARALGFTAIEGRGVDTDAAAVAAATAAAQAHADLAIGLSFEVGALGEVLEEEGDNACDIILCLGDTLDRVGSGAIPLVARAMIDCAHAAVIATIGRGARRRCVIEAFPIETA